jgi:hypothetical protein
MLLTMVAFPATSGHDQDITATQDDRDGWSLSGRLTEQEDPRMSQPAVIRCEGVFTGQYFICENTPSHGDVTDEMEMSGR